jgi:hypothetical protein
MHIEAVLWMDYEWGAGKAFSRFLEGLWDGKILGAKCRKCGKVFVPPRIVCPQCFCKTDWKEVSDEGEIVSFTKVFGEFAGAPMPPPYTLVLVKLDGADTTLLHILLEELKTEEPKIGARVKAVWNKERKRSIFDIKGFKLKDLNS